MTRSPRSTGTTTSVARLKVVLDDVEPQVMRRLDVPLNVRLDRLHEALQATLGWSNSHLYELVFKGVGFGLPDEGWGDGPMDARKVRLIDIIEDTGTKSFKYLYDFSDGWEHSIKIEKIMPAIDGVSYPCLIEASGACPPEDSGGPRGFTEARQALADPNHERHQEVCEWWGIETYDPAAVNIPAIEASLEKLAKQWAPRRRTPK